MTNSSVPIIASDFILICFLAVAVILITVVLTEHDNRIRTDQGIEIVGSFDGITWISVELDEGGKLKPDLPYCRLTKEIDGNRVFSIMLVPGKYKELLE